MSTIEDPAPSRDRRKVAEKWPEWDGWERAAFLREKTGMTHGQVAAKAGLSRSWVLQLENGHQTNPNLRALLAYCQAIGVSPAALM